MNKKLLLAGLVTLVSCSISALTMSPSMEGIRVLPREDFEPYQAESKPKTAQEAFDNVWPKLQEYQRNASRAEIDNLVEYLKYYKSWYQPVTPAPKRVIDKLTPNDHKIVKTLQREAKAFVSKPQQTGEMSRMGASTLSRSGEDFYIMVMNALDKPQKPIKKPMSKPAFKKNIVY